MPKKIHSDTITWPNPKGRKILSTGRNGDFMTTGVHIMLNENKTPGEITLTGINSRGKLATGDIALPHNREVCLRLAHFFTEAAEEAAT